eukprot:531650-Amphidinium_carterae.2
MVSGMYKDLADKYSVFQYQDEGYELVICYRVGSNEEVVKVTIHSERAKKQQRTSWHHEAKSPFTWKTHPGLDRISSLISSGQGGVIYCAPNSVLPLVQLLMPHGQWNVLQLALVPDPPVYEVEEDDGEPTNQADDAPDTEERTFSERIQFHLDRIEHHTLRIRELMTEGESAIAFNAL